MAPSQKGAIAEIEIAAAAIHLELFVLRPLSDGEDTTSALTSVSAC